MADMDSVIIAKSDQTNADDLIAGPITITITAVKVTGGEQPVSIFYDGDNGKPWKPCKTMAKVLVHNWGRESKNYVGKSLTLYRDPKVKWAGMEVGGIRISHMSHIESSVTMVLNESRQNRRPYKVDPLTVTHAAAKAQNKPVQANPAPAATTTPATPSAPASGQESGQGVNVWGLEIENVINMATDPEALRSYWSSVIADAERWPQFKKACPELAKNLKKMAMDKVAALNATQEPDDGSDDAI